MFRRWIGSTTASWPSDDTGGHAKPDFCASWAQVISPRTADVVSRVRVSRTGSLHGGSAKSNGGIFGTAVYHDILEFSARVLDVGLSGHAVPDPFASSRERNTR